MDTILDKEKSRYIYNTSYLLLISTFYAIYRNHYIIATSPGIVFLTSIHYWKHPDYSYRRYLDMVLVKLSLAYHCYVSYTAEYGTRYYIIISIAITFYQIGNYYHSKKDYWKSTYCHMLLHILANVANIALYSGYLTPPSTPKIDTGGT